MGDRTYVTVKINKSFLDHNILKLDDIPTTIDDRPHEDTLKKMKENENIILGFNEVNYGIDDSLIDFLCSKNIEFNYYWDSGCDYGSGHRYYRFCEKTQAMTYDEFYDAEEALYNLVNSLKDLAPKDIKKEILKQYEKIKQNEFSKELDLCNKARFINNCKK